jgi:Fe2+ transport system protein B
VNKGDEAEDGGVAQARERLELPDGVRCVPVNALEKDSVKEVLLELLYAVMDEVEAAEASGSASTATRASRSSR